MLAEKEDSSYPCDKSMRLPTCIFFKDARFVFKLDKLGVEIASIALPAALALTADPIASLVDTAFIGQIGSVGLAAVGVSIALFNQVSRIAIFPLVSVTTSFVAEEDTIGRVKPQPQPQPQEETENLEQEHLIAENSMPFL
ncbi:protein DETOXIFICATION 42-like [Humulus lupulus]|uniref:protein DETOXIFICATION 42-like n=1 Tax=Humulus lupulus TaxID=3486 RepID=UPI002B41783A|nr:protein DETOXIFICATION 42-like [Humulus lupulus]